MSWPKRMSLVEVSWVDSWGSSSWQAAENAVDTDPLLVCVSVGYLLHSGLDAVVISQSQNMNGDVMATLTIPRSCVRDVTTIRGV